jgi:hypothetical protein
MTETVLTAGTPPPATPPATSTPAVAVADLHKSPEASDWIKLLAPELEKLISEALAKAPADPPAPLAHGHDDLLEKHNDLVLRHEAMVQKVHDQASDLADVQAQQAWSGFLKTPIGKSVAAIAVVVLGAISTYLATGKAGTGVVPALQVEIVSPIKIDTSAMPPPPSKLPATVVPVTPEAPKTAKSVPIVPLISESK